MIPLIFSIPVHEKLEVVLDQIINYKFFNPECGIVLHFSNSFDYANSCITRDEFEEFLKNMDNIFINPESLRTEYGDIIQAHLSNFEYIKNQYEFDYFILCASNELFIKCGLYQSIKGYDCGIGYIEFGKDINEFQEKEALKDKSLQAILQSVGGGKIIKSQVEGTFFTKALFSDMCEIINKNYDYKLMETPYAQEEFYFSTIIWNKKENGEKINIYKNGMFTYILWERDLRIETTDIKRLQGNHENSFFSVKRVPRELNNYIRSYIREKSGYYCSEMQLFNSLPFSETHTYDGRKILPLPKFNSKNISDLLDEMSHCLITAQNYGKERQFINIISQIEDEYREAILTEVSAGNIQVLMLLIQITKIVSTNEIIQQQIISPLRWIMQYIYENKILKEICCHTKIMLYGAGEYGRIFLNFLRKNGLSNRVTNFIISDSEESKSEVDGIPVAKLSEVLHNKEIKIFITVHEIFYKEIENNLCRNEYQNYEIIKEDFLQTLIIEPNCFWQEKKI